MMILLPRITRRGFYVTESDNQNLLDAIVKLTSQRDQETLAGALVDAISSLGAATSVSVYSLGSELGQLSAKVLASNNSFEPVGVHLTSLESRRDLKTCIDSKQAVTTDSAYGLKITHPVCEQGTVIGLMSHEYATDAQPNSILIDSLVSIYSNQQSLLNHQQRDGLTGLFNRVALQNWLGKALSEEAPADRRTHDDSSLGCFAMFDIDYFKHINDSRGHLYGDEVLLTFADLMRESFRYNDLLFRYGGEEFVAILTDTQLDAALTVLERFRTTIAQYKFAQLNQVTVTIGVARIAPHLKPALLIDRADKALYYGKEHGRNQVNAFEWLEQGQIVPSLATHPHSFKLF